MTTSLASVSFFKVNENVVNKKELHIQVKKGLHFFHLQFHLIRSLHRLEAENLQSGVCSGNKEEFLGIQNNLDQHEHKHS